MAMLCHLAPDDWIDFAMLKKKLSLTDGNLGAQLTKLEEVTYLKIKKEFIDRRPRTRVQATLRGRSAFDSHCAALRKIIEEQR